MTVPYTFASATTSIPLSQLDSNFATAITLGNTAVYLGNTTTTIGNLTLTNANISSVSAAITPAQGGTGLTTLTANNVLIGNGTSNVTFVAPGTSGNVLASNGTTWVSQAASTGTSIANGTSNVSVNSSGGNVTVATAGTTAMTIDTSQNVGVGVVPSAWGAGSTALQLGNGGIWKSGSRSVDWMVNGYHNGTNYIYNTSNAATYYRQYDGQHIWYNAPSGTAGNAITFTQAMTLDSSGNFIVGGTSASAKIDVQTSGNGYGVISQNSNQATPSNYLYWGYASSATRFVVYGNGGIANYQANNVNLSDRREKTNFAPAKSYLDTICAIPVQTFNYIDQNLEEDGGLTLGVVAQDVQAVAPELVTESNWGTKEDPKMRLSIYQTDLQYALMKCIQEQQAIIEQLKADVAALKGKA